MTDFATAVDSLISFGNLVIVPLIIAIAFLAFIWGVFQYFFLGATDTEKQAQGRSFVLWSVIALAVIFSVWGLVNVFLQTFGLA
jgi:hypothetical protein